MPLTARTGGFLCAGGADALFALLRGGAAALFVLLRAAAAVPFVLLRTAAAILSFFRSAGASARRAPSQPAPCGAR